MKMNRNEMEALYAFGCPNLKATVERLRMVAALAPDPVAKKLFYMISVKLSAEGVERWCNNGNCMQKDCRYSY